MTTYDDGTQVNDEGQTVLVWDDEVIYPPELTRAEINAALVESKSLPKPPAAEVNLDVPFIHQMWDTADDFDGHWACGPTSAAMVLAYYSLLQPHVITVTTPFKHESQFGYYVSNDFTQEGMPFRRNAKTASGKMAKGLYGSILDNVPAVGGWVAVSQAGRDVGIMPVLNHFLAKVGKKVSLVNPSEDRAKDSLRNGNPIIISGAPFSLAGHLMVIRGFYHDARLNLNGWIMNDPYGYRSDGTRDYDGANVAYLWSEIKPKYMYLIEAR